MIVSTSALVSKSVILGDELAISGGVASNQKFRDEIKLLQQHSKVGIYIPKKEYSTDNGAMIAISGYYKYKRKEFTNVQVDVKPRYKLEKLSVL